MPTFLFKLFTYILSRNEAKELSSAAVPNLGYVKNQRDTPDYHQFKNNAKIFNKTTH